MAIPVEVDYVDKGDHYGGSQAASLSPPYSFQVFVIGTN